MNTYVQLLNILPDNGCFVNKKEGTLKIRLEFVLVGIFIGFHESPPMECRESYQSREEPVGGDYPNAVNEFIYPLFSKDLVDGGDFQPLTEIP